MVYSCFDPPSGLYRYFQDDTALPINADLPVPKLPKPSGKVGVASIDAGRPLPASAQLVGQGWHAKGMVVQCGGGALNGLGDAMGWVTGGGWKWLVGGLAGLYVVKKVL